MEHSLIFLGIIIALIILLIGYLANNPDTSSIDIRFYQFKVLVKKGAVSRKNSIARKIVRRRVALKQKSKEIKEATSSK